MKVRGRVVGARRKSGTVNMILSDIEVAGQRFAVNSKEHRRPGIDFFNAEICIDVGERQGLYSCVGETLEMDLVDGAIQCNPLSIGFGGKRQTIFGDVDRECVLGYVTTAPGMNFSLDTVSPIEAMVLGTLEQPDGASIEEVKSGKWALMVPESGPVNKQDVLEQIR